MIQALTPALLLCQDVSNTKSKWAFFLTSRNLLSRREIVKEMKLQIHSGGDLNQPGLKPKGWGRELRRLPGGGNSPAEVWGTSRSWIDEERQKGISGIGNMVLGRGDYKQIFKADGEREKERGVGVRQRFWLRIMSELEWSFTLGFWCFFFRTLREGRGWFRSIPGSSEADRFGREWQSGGGKGSWEAVAVIQMLVRRG